MKKIIVFVLLAVMLCGLCACGKSETAAVSAVPTTAQPVNEPVQQEENKLGVVLCKIEDTSQENVQHYCDELGIDLLAFDDWMVYCCDDIEACDSCIMDYIESECSDILVVGPNEFISVADDYKERNPDVNFYSFLSVFPIITASYEIGYEKFDDIYRDFSEGRAWVRIFSPDVDYAVIDENGFIIYSCKAADIGFKSFATTKFEQGTSVIFGGEGYSDRYPGMIIIDINGQILFDSREAPDGVTYYYYGYGNGVYLVVINESDFSSNKWYCCEMDRNGEILDKTEISERLFAYMAGMKYYGDSIFAGSSIGTTIRSSIVYNADTNNLFLAEGLGSDFSAFNPLKNPFEDGVALASSGKLVTPDDLKNADACAAWNKSTEKSSFKDYSEGLGYSNGGYYNRFGELVFSLPEDWNISNAGSFSGGFAALFLKGADKNSYVTLVDKEGQILYDPLKVSDYTMPAWHGYISAVVEGEEVIIDPTGNFVAKSELDMLDDEYTVGNIVVHGGATRNEGSYTFADGRVLNEAFLVENYDELVKTGYVPSSVADVHKEELDTPKTEKIYKAVDGFTIEGKWKSIGSYGFGQAQPGAIVVFDGNNCNFFSPKDTYAFSKDGDNYKLECTSFMSTDTLTFTVKTVDEDNIDIYYGDNVTELTRVG